MLKGQNAENIIYGNSFSEDGHDGQRFDYLLANPPFGVEWKKVKDEVQDEHDTKGFAGRFGAGLPRINDGSFLFLQHMISKMKRSEDGGSRVAIVFNGSPLFTGAAGSSESEIRRWVIENDWLEAVVALPDQLFYNTGISTYFWVVTNRKTPGAARQGAAHRRPRLLDEDAQIPRGETQTTRRRPDRRHRPPLRGRSRRTAAARSSLNEAFGFMRITVERPMRRVWTATDDQIDQVKAHRTFDKLGKGEEGGGPVSRREPPGGPHCRLRRHGLEGEPVRGVR